MIKLALSDLAVCGIEELPDHGRRAYTHVLSLIDPDWPDIPAFDGFAPHDRTTLRFHDVIDPLPGKTPPSLALVQEVLNFSKGLADGVAKGDEIRLLVHCHMGVSRSSAAMLSFLAQVYQGESVDFLYERLRQIRKQAWPNSVMVGLIDDHLEFGGKLVDGLRVHYGRRLQERPEVGDWMMANGRRREVEMALPPS